MVLHGEVQHHGEQTTVQPSAAILMHVDHEGSTSGSAAFDQSTHGLSAHQSNHQSNHQHQAGQHEQVFDADHVPGATVHGDAEVGHVPADHAVQHSAMHVAQHPQQAMFNVHDVPGATSHGDAVMESTLPTTSQQPEHLAFNVDQVPGATLHADGEDSTPTQHTVDNQPKQSMAFHVDDVPGATAHAGDFDQHNSAQRNVGAAQQLEQPPQHTGFDIDQVPGAHAGNHAGFDIGTIPGAHAGNHAGFDVGTIPGAHAAQDEHVDPQQQAAHGLKHAAFDIDQIAGAHAQDGHTASRQHAGHEQPQQLQQPQQVFDVREVPGANVHQGSADQAALHDAVVLDDPHQQKTVLLPGASHVASAHDVFPVHATAGSNGVVEQGGESTGQVPVPVQVDNTEPVSGFASFAKQAAQQPAEQGLLDAPHNTVSRLHSSDQAAKLPDVRARQSEQTSSQAGRSHAHNIQLPSVGLGVSGLSRV